MTGVNFSPAIKKIIQDAIDQNEIEKAQQIILDVLGSAFAADAAREVVRVEDEPGDDVNRWFLLTMTEHQQKVMTRLLETRSRFADMGAQNEECAEYVLSVLDYISGDSLDDPTADWTIKLTPLT